MAFQISVAARNAMLDAWETATGTAAIVEIRTLAPPADCAAADVGTLLASMTLPSDWMNAASTGTKTKLGTWSDASANATGTAAHFRVWDSGRSACHGQGTVTITGGGGDMTIASTAITLAQPVVVTGFTLTAGNA